MISLKQILHVLIEEIRYSADKIKEPRRMDHRGNIKNQSNVWISSMIGDI